MAARSSNNRRTLTSDSSSTACWATRHCSPAKTRSRKPGGSAPPSSTAGARTHPTLRACPITTRAHGDRRRPTPSWLAAVAPGTAPDPMTTGPTAPAAQRHAHASGLHAVESALADLHLDVLRASNAESTQVRLSVVNIVAACNDTTLAARAAEAVVTIAARHPARAIVVVADPEAPSHLESDISLHDTGVGGQYMELVRLDVGGKAAYHLSSIVIPLLIPDIPTHLWLVGAPPLTQAFRADAVSLCDSVILDTGAYPDPLETLQLVAHELETYDGTLALSDITWERIRIWRETVAVAFDGPEVRPWLRRVVGVDVVSLGSISSADAWLFAGWMASRLGWPGSGGPEIALS